MMNRARSVRLLVALALGVLAAGARGGDVGFRWLNATGGALDLAVGARLVHQQVPAGGLTKPARLREGSHPVELRNGAGRVEGFCWEAEAGGKMLLVTAVVDGAVQTRVLGPVVRVAGQASVRVFNAAAGQMLEVTAGGRTLRVRPGREVVVVGQGEIRGRLLAADAKGRDFKVVVPAQPACWDLVAILRPEGQAGFLILKEGAAEAGRSWEPGGDGPVVSVNEASVAAGAADSPVLDWATVESKVCWFNACQPGEALDLVSNGAAAFRRVQGGAVTGFVKWPQGDWRATLSGRARGVVGKLAFTVGPQAKVLVLTTGGGGQRVRSLVLASDLDGRQLNEPRLRIVNGFGSGALRGDDPGTPALAIKPAQPGPAVTGVDGWFAAVALSHPGYAGGGPFKLAVPRVRLPAGDWLAVGHPDLLGAPALTWVDLLSGRIIEPDELNPAEP